MGMVSWLLADEGKARFLWAGLLLAGALIISAIVILWVSRWRKRYSSDVSSVSDERLY